MTRQLQQHPQQQPRRTSMLFIVVVVMVAVALLLPSADAWAPTRPLRMSAADGKQQQQSPKQQQQQQRGLTDRRATLGHKALALSVASPLLWSVLGGQPLPARAADENKKEAAIQEARERLEVEFKSGKNIAKLEAAIEAGDWGELKTYSKEYDAFLRQELMGTAKKGAVDKKAAQSVREATMYSLIKVNKGARNADAAGAREGIAELKQNLGAFLQLEWKAPGTAEE